MQTSQKVIQLSNQMCPFSFRLNAKNVLSTCKNTYNSSQNHIHNWNTETETASDYQLQ